MLNSGFHGVCLAALLSFSAVAAPQKIRVSDPALAAALIGRGGHLVEDYGGFKILETEEDTVGLAASGRVQGLSDSSMIRLNSGSLDTREPQVRSLSKPLAGFSGKRLHLVQFAGPIKPEWRFGLESNGVQVVDYIPNNAYLVYGGAAELGRVQAWANSARQVQWNGPFQDAYKLHPRVQAAAAQNLNGALLNFQLVQDSEANPVTLALIGRLASEPLRGQFRILHFLNVVARVSSGQLAEIAARPDVISMQPYREPRPCDERQDQIVAGNISGGLPTGPGYLAWLAGKGFAQSQFDASGFAVDISDSGLDNGTTTPGHFGLYTMGDSNATARVIYNRLEGSPNEGSTLEGCDGHGTINTHIVAGYCSLGGFPFADAGGYNYGLGVCPFVRVGSSVIFDPSNFTYPNYSYLQADAYASGARISANSWGVTGWDGTYDAEAQAYDTLVRDAQQAGSTCPTAGNQEMVIVFAAGNDGPTSGSISTPGCAKNLITVGASENVRSLSVTNGGFDAAGNSGCNYDADTSANSAEDMAAFSSRGPCADGRMKPDLVAPGTHITGGVAQAGAPWTGGTGAAIACFSAFEVCALPGRGSIGSMYNFFPLGQQFYTVSSGTSHSTPAVAGACALLRQYFINGGKPPPSPAMTKAWLINSARYLAGSGAGDSLFSPNQGMGELNLGVAFDGVERLARDQLSTDKFTATGQTRVFTVIIPDPTKPFRVTLAWSDAPGSTTGDAFKNDLDLTVSVGGNTYQGNVFSNALSVAGGTNDPRNNLESVFLPAGGSGVAVITVTAANINSDGVPNEDPVLDQDFALVAYNAISQPTLVLDSAALVSESCKPTNGLVDPGETVAVSFSVRNVGEIATTNLIATLLTTNGVVYPTGPVNYGHLAGGGTNVAMAFSFVAVGACGDTIHPTLRFSDGATDLGQMVVPFKLGQSVIVPRAYTNSAAILIPGTGTAGPGSIYPSTLTVTGVGQTIQEATVGLEGLSHGYPADIDVMLVGPTGANVLLMSYCGGSLSVTNLSVAFNDTAEPLPVNAAVPLTSGLFAPTDGSENPSLTLFAPAPAGPYGHALAAFAGLSPNGTWSLYIDDHDNGDTGSLSRGWWINFTFSNAVCCASATSTSPPPPSIRSIWLGEGMATLAWAAIPGQIYRVQYSQNLCSTNWISLTPDVTATNATAFLTDFIAPDAQRFYRIQVLP